MSARNPGGRRCPAPRAVPGARRFRASRRLPPCRPETPTCLRTVEAPSAWPPANGLAGQVNRVRHRPQRLSVRSPPQCMGENGWGRAPLPPALPQRRAEYLLQTRRYKNQICPGNLRVRAASRTMPRLHPQAPKSRHMTTTTHPPGKATTHKSHLGLAILALGMGGFGIGVTEFAMMGLLKEV